MLLLSCVNIGKIFPSLSPELFEKCQTDVTHELAPERMRAKLINDALDNHDDNDIDKIDIEIEN